MIDARGFHTADIALSNIDAVASLEQRCFPSPWSFAACTAELSVAGGGGYTATDDENGRVVGYIFFRVIVDEMHILKIAVLPAWRKRGVGSALLEKALILARAKWLRRICLEVRAANTAAIHLYNKYGFTSTGVRPGYYENREDAVLMTKNIEEGVLTWLRQ